MRKMQNKKQGFNLLMILFILVPSTAAFGVTTLYWNDKPLFMHPGQSKEIYVELQNMVGGEDLRLKAEITEGSEIADLINPNKEYLVPFGRKDIKVNIRITVPENAALEDRYIVKLSFKQAAKEEGKMVQMSSSVGTAIPVVIKSAKEIPKEPMQEMPAAEERTSFTTILIVSLILLAIIIIAYVIFKLWYSTHLKKP